VELAEPYFFFAAFLAALRAGAFFAALRTAFFAAFFAGAFLATVFFAAAFLAGAFFFAAFLAGAFLAAAFFFGAAFFFAAITRLRAAATPSFTDFTAAAALFFTALTTGAVFLEIAAPISDAFSPTLSIALPIELPELFAFFIVPSSWLADQNFP